MLPMRFFRNRTFALANVASLFMCFGMFGSIFLLAQFFQTVQGYSPLGSGLRILPWTAMPMIVAPIAGALSDRIGRRGSWAPGSRCRRSGSRGSRRSRRRRRRTSTSSCRSRSPGSGWRSSSPRSRTSSSRRSAAEEEGQASGANNAIRELGGVFGVAVLASVFSHYGGYASGTSFVDGMTPAVYVGAAVVALGSVAAFAIKRRPKAEVVALEPSLEAAA